MREKSHFLYIVLFVSFLLFLPQAKAEDEVLSLKASVEKAAKSNPEILSAKSAYEAQAAKIWPAASLNDPVLELEYDKLYADRQLMGDPMKTYAISQEIPFPTKLYLRARIASKLAKAAYQNYKAKEREVISKVKSAYSELFIIYKSTELQKENKQVLEQFSSTATTRYSVGKVTQADALKAQVELAKIDNELIMLEQRRLTQQAQLNVLRNMDPKVEIGMPSPEGAIKFTRSLEEFYDLAKLNNPELRSYRHAIEKGEAAYGLSLNEFMPDFMVKFKQMYRKDGFEEDAWMGMVGVSVPIWFFQKQVFGVKEMKAELEMLEAEFRQKENAVLFDIRDSYARVEANKKLVELYETAFIPQADETVTAALRGYESEKTDFLTLLDSQRMLIEFKLEHYKAILNLRIALADLERSVGIDIEE